VVDFSGGVPKADWLRGGIEWLVPVLVLTLAAVALAGRRDRERRAAAVAFAVATGNVWALTQQVGFTLVDYQSQALIGGAVSVGVAFVYRARLASLVTHATLLAFLAVAWAALVGWLEPILFGSNEFAPIDASQGVPRALLVGAWWILLALGLGLVARREAPRALAADERGDGMEGDAADRRATLTRLAAGLVGVLAATLAATTSTEIGRALPPLVGDGAILVVSLVLLRLATHRASAYLYPAALGIVVALSDLNFTFIGQQSGVGIALLVEGAILLGAGLLADRLRRGLGGTEPMNAAIAVAPAE